MRNWKPEDIFDVACPSCGEEIEFWKDEPFRICSACTTEIRNPRIDLGCAKWCKSAAECLGAETAAAIMEGSMCDRLIAEMKVACRGDSIQIGRTLKLLERADRLVEKEGGRALALVVKAAVLLHPTGQQARATLDKLGVDSETAGHVCRIIESRQGNPGIDTLESRIVEDASRLLDDP
jgi:hypothetical protein